MSDPFLTSFPKNIPQIRYISEKMKEDTDGRYCELVWVGLSPEMQQIPEESGGVDMIFMSGNRNMRDGRGLGLQTASPQWGQPMFF